MYLKLASMVVAIIASGVTAAAALTVKFSDYDVFNGSPGFGLLNASVLVLDNGPEDLDPALGRIRFSGQVGRNQVEYLGIGTRSDKLLSTRETLTLERLSTPCMPDCPGGSYPPGFLVSTFDQTDLLIPDMASALVSAQIVGISDVDFIGSLNIALSIQGTDLNVHSPENGFNKTISYTTDFGLGPGEKIVIVEHNLQHQFFGGDLGARTQFLGERKVVVTPLPAPALLMLTAFAALAGWQRVGRRGTSASRRAV